jgi:hypothetical protein
MITATTTQSFDLPITTTIEFVAPAEATQKMVKKSSQGDSYQISGTDPAAFLEAWSAVYVQIRKRAPDTKVSTQLRLVRDFYAQDDSDDIYFDDLDGMVHLRMVS